MGSVLVCQELSEGATRWGDLLPQPGVGEGKRVLLLFSTVLCFIYFPHPQTLARAAVQPSRRACSPFATPPGA